jgi:hypothetical protein
MTTRREFIGGAAAAAVTLAGRRAKAGGERPLLVSVITAPRPRHASYVVGTLAAADAGLPPAVRRLLICDGPWTAIQPPPATWERVDLGERARRHGPLPDNKTPGWLAIRAAAAAGADLLFLEDDIRPLGRRRGDDFVAGRGNAFEYMAGHDVPPEVAFTSFFSAQRGPGIYGADAFQMSQAVKIPHRSLDWLVRAPAIEQLTWTEVVGVDLAIAHLGRAAGWRFEQTSNLVEHIGLWSAAHPGNERTPE